MWWGLNLSKKPPRLQPLQLSSWMYSRSSSTHASKYRTTWRLVLSAASAWTSRSARSLLNTEKKIKYGQSHPVANK